MDEPGGTSNVPIPKNNTIDSIMGRGLFRTILFGFLAISLLPLVTISIINYQRTHKSLTSDAKGKLIGAATLKSKQIQSFFEDSLSALFIQARLKMTVSMLKDLRRSFEATGLDLPEFVKSSEWKRISEQYEDDIGFFLTTNHFYDLFIIDSEGNILFTDKKQDHLGTTIFTGTYSKTMFGRACQFSFGKEMPGFSGFERYGPSNNSMAGFLVSVIFDENENKLGLAAVQFQGDTIKRIIQSESGLDHQGEVFLINATFWFTLELKKSGKKSKPAKSFDLGKAKVLIVDDNAASLEVMETMLSSWGVEHSFAKSGAEGLDMLNKAIDAKVPYNIAVLDMHMPGMNDYISKPMKMDGVADLIEKWLPG
ncbi:MAG: hypothetical protein GY729_00660 [Desulfobacteraceae bacterium]|nr:hypothetical protein [Desulfobacteraceae bacterium]